ncbi:MAG: AAA family ATPase [Bacteroidota bacterium]
MPQAIIVGGPNGAGKSTLAYEYVEVYGYTYLSADEIAARLRPDEPSAARIEAGKQFFVRLRDLIAEGRDFIVESTLAGEGFRRILDRLARAGYTTHIAFVFLDSPALCIRRVAQRVQAGGHDVPTDDIVRRYTRSKANFWTIYRFQVDGWFLVYNAGEQFQEVATGSRGVFEVSDEDRFTLFLSDIDGAA